MKKVDAFDNSPFRDQNEYIEFVKDNGIAGTEAITLKKKMDKRMNIGEPEIIDPRLEDCP